MAEILGETLARVFTVNKTLNKGSSEIHSVSRSTSSTRVASERTEHGRAIGTTGARRKPKNRSFALCCQSDTKCAGAPTPPPAGPPTIPISSSPRTKHRAAQKPTDSYGRPVHTIVCHRNQCDMSFPGRLSLERLQRRRKTFIVGQDNTHRPADID